MFQECLEVRESSPLSSQKMFKPGLWALGQGWGLRGLGTFGLGIQRSSALNPKTLNPKPQSPNPKPQTLNPKP